AFHVTGVQTCALPILSRTAPPQPALAEAVRCRSLGHPQEAEAPWPKRAPRQGASARSGREKPSSAEGIVKARVESIHRQRRLSEIGRASCRERRAKTA